MAKQSLLVADADPRSLRILEVALRKAGFTVATAVDGAEALRRIQRSAPDLVLCEAALPGQDGLSVCRAVRADARIAGMPFVVMSADKTPPLQGRAIEAGADDFLAKPLLIKELVTRVRLLLERRETQRNAQRESPAALTGTVGELGLVDLFQSLDNWRKSATVVCESEGRKATVWVRDGQVIDADLPPLGAEAAFYRVLNWDTGSFRVEFGAVEREEQIVLGTAGLLMEAMRRVDELGRAAETLPLGTQLAVDFGVLAQKLGELPDEVNGILKLFDGKRGLRDALDSSPLDDLSALAVVQRLMADGVLRTADGKAHGPAQKPSLQQWLGAAAPVSAPPLARSGFVFSPDDERAVAPDADAVAPDADALAERPIPLEPPTPINTLELVRFPPLRGVRRERLRREADEARAQIAAGAVLRLSRIVELPAFRLGGADALSPAVRRMSPAVGEAAKKFAPDLPVAALQGLTAAEVATAPAAPRLPLSEIATDPGFRAPHLDATEISVPTSADEEPTATEPATPAPQAAEERIAGGDEPAVAAPQTAPAQDAAAAQETGAGSDAAAAEAAPTQSAAAAPALTSLAPPSEPLSESRAASAQPAPARVGPVPAGHYEADDFEADLRAPLGRRHRRWPWVSGALAAAAALFFLLRPQPATNKKDLPWLEGAGAQPISKTEPAKPEPPRPDATPPATTAAQATAPSAAGLVVAAAPPLAPPAAPKAAAEPPTPPRSALAPSGPTVATASLVPTPETDDYARALDSGEKLLKRGRYRQAVTEFKRAVQQNPESVPALLALGDAWLEADAPRSALKPLQRAASLDPRSARAQLLLGTAWQSLGKNPDAVKAYQRYLTLEPSGEFARDVRSILANLAP